MNDIDDVTTAKMDICRKQIEKEYGKEISNAVGKVMSQLMITVITESIVRDIDHIKLLGATCKAIRTIDRLSEEYVDHVQKVSNN